MHSAGKVNDSMKVRSHPGATTEDIVDYVKPIAHKKPKMLVIHTGTNECHQEDEYHQEGGKSGTEHS